MFCLFVVFSDVCFGRLEPEVGVEDVDDLRLGPDRVAQDLLFCITSSRRCCSSISRAYTLLIMCVYYLMIMSTLYCVIPYIIIMFAIVIYQ